MEITTDFPRLATNNKEGFKKQKKNNRILYKEVEWWVRNWKFSIIFYSFFSGFDKNVLSVGTFSMKKCALSNGGLVPPKKGLDP